jgi:hypothetical protein
MKYIRELAPQHITTIAPTRGCSGGGRGTQTSPDADEEWEEEEGAGVSAGPDPVRRGVEDPPVPKTASVEANPEHEVARRPKARNARATADNRPPPRDDMIPGPGLAF